MFHTPTWPGVSQRVPVPRRDKHESVIQALTAWSGRIWRAMCESAERPGRKVPYY